MEQLYYGIPEAGQILGLKRSSVYKLLDEGRLRSVRIGSRRLVTADSIRDLADGLAKAA